MAAAALTTCPKELCGMKKWGKGKVKRAISAGAGLIFKGSGFYITDYGKDGKGPRKPEVEPASGDATTGKAESKTESKSGGEPEAKGGSEAALGQLRALGGGRVGRAQRVARSGPPGRGGGRHPRHAAVRRRPGQPAAPPAAGRR